MSLTKVTADYAENVSSLGPCVGLNALGLPELISACIALSCNMLYAKICYCSYTVRYKMRPLSPPTLLLHLKFINSIISYLLSLALVLTATFA